MRILNAQLDLTDGDITKPAIRMRGDKHWLLTFIAMLIDVMKAEGGLTDEEAHNLLRNEQRQLQIFTYETHEGRRQIQ